MHHPIPAESPAAAHQKVSNSRETDLPAVLGKCRATVRNAITARTLTSMMSESVRVSNTPMCVWVGVWERERESLRLRAGRFQGTVRHGGPLRSVKCEKSRWGATPTFSGRGGGERGGVGGGEEWRGGRGDSQPPECSLSFSLSLSLSISLSLSQSPSMF